MQNETWEKEFDERFHRVGMDTNFGFTDGLDGYEQLKSFIRHLLSSHNAELRRKIKGMRKDVTEDQEEGIEYDNGFDDAIEQVLGLIANKNQNDIQK